jgi:hypothetical protein
VFLGYIIYNEVYEIEMALGNKLVVVGGLTILSSMIDVMTSGNSLIALINHFGTGCLLGGLASVDVVKRDLDHLYYYKLI